MSGNNDLDAASTRDSSSCFVIGPIGDANTTTRKVADQILNYVIRPVVTEFGFDPLRADELGEPGLVTRQIMRHVIDDALVVADLTGRNPNVFYELAIRHAIRKPLVQIISGENTLPFDIFDTRTIFFDITDLDSVDLAKKELSAQVKALVADPKPLDNPISEAIDLGRYTDSGDSAKNDIGAVLEAVADLRAEVRTLERTAALGGTASYDSSRPLELSPSDYLKGDFRKRVFRADFDAERLSAEQLQSVRAYLKTAPVEGPTSGASNDSVDVD